VKEEIKVTLATHWGYSRVARLSNQAPDDWSVRSIQMIPSCCKIGREVYTAVSFGRYRRILQRASPPTNTSVIGLDVHIGACVFCFIYVHINSLGYVLSKTSSPKLRYARKCLTDRRRLICCAGKSSHTCRFVYKHFRKDRVPKPSSSSRWTTVAEPSRGEISS